MKLLKVLAIGATIGGVALATAHEKVDAAEWTPRSVEAIKADVAKSNGNYTIVEGDYLWGISQATNITVQKLADMNKIANVDLIYAGNKLVFDGNVATVQNNKGETVAQSVIQPQDKVDSTKPVGQPVQGTTNSATQNTTTSSTDNTVAGNTQTGDQTTGNTGTTMPSTPESNGGATQTPTQPDNNQTGSTGNTTTPSQPNTGGNQNNSGTSNGGTTTPSQPNNGGNQNGSTGGNSGTTTPSKPQAPTIVSGYIGNTGKVFDTDNEATTWAEEELDKDFALGSSGNGWTRYVVITIYYSDGTEKFSVSLYKN
ncbi:LysM peptidoglycan-binding domain-containing protein [Enterococcus faecium]|uniref:LysM peptidoglycan-binding domain-containing protein n=1 Tax=Enterococcus faecium TaxID=1352 RepID=UPI0019132A7E|nr:LysM domain-containing protein [Enterococcus faecium]MBK5028865.1 LysM peptidoglycan-binding domain-containing protein [Enterococcus faecium]MBK5039583.1 LysM peptidoglycan-binding domain-containing protein [Enterococcus faecium]MBK5044295.1 LysM peptidoglycan-binding domain-containing protein [Enterococcus faecium]MBK5069187.1 LysM peptidoglycan-binding domain-containing protein [Enterococcus faecium]MBK5132719.1 LysM peptidoglycan-binding domain-containing protein [Enterococcus faecium]